MSWNHRVVKEKIDAVDGEKEDWYSIREVFYNDDGSIFGYTSEPITISGHGIDELRQTCLWILACLNKDTLIDGEVVFIDKDDPS